MSDECRETPFQLVVTFPVNEKKDYCELPMFKKRAAGERAALFRNVTIMIRGSARIGELCEAIHLPRNFLDERLEDICHYCHYESSAMTGTNGRSVNTPSEKASFALWHGANMLRDPSKTLSSYGIGSGAVLRAHPFLRGGGNCFGHNQASTSSAAAPGNNQQQQQAPAATSASGPALTPPIAPKTSAPAA